MDAPRIRMTSTEYLAMPDDGKRYELHDGELIEMPSATMLHNWIVSVIFHALMKIVYAHSLGFVGGDGLDYVLDKDATLKPDVSFIAGMKPPFPQYPTRAPDLAVEVLSPSNSASEMNYKITVYFQYGSRLVWVIDPERKRVTVHHKQADERVVTTHLTLDGVLSGEDVLPDFHLSVREIFAGLV